MPRPSQALPAALFFLSGCASLIFETLCMRKLALVMGNTVQSASATVSAFLFGLGFGAYLGGLVVKRSKNPLRTFAIIEALAGVGALIVLSAIPSLPSLLVPVAHASPGLLTVCRVLLAFLLLFAPASAMGASLPVLSHYYVENLNGRFMPSLGMLYGINTLGAAFGVLITDFFLVERLGVNRTGWVSFALYVLVALLAQFLARLENPKQPSGEATRPALASQGRATEALIVLTASGFFGLTYQVLWTRMLTFFNGNDVFAFSVTLSVYLLGLVTGSGIVAWRGDRWGGSRSLLGAVMILLGFSAYLSLFSVGVVRQLRESMAGFPILGDFGPNFLSCGLVMLPSTVLLGLLFPLAAERVRIAGGQTGVAVGKAYVYNTLGSVLGGLLAGYVLLPKLGLQSSLATQSALTVLVGVAILARDTGARKWGACASLIFVALLFATPRDFFLRTFYGAAYSAVVYSADDQYGSVALTRGWDAELMQTSENLLVDGFNMAGNTVTAKRYTTGLAALPILLNKSARNVLIVCMGLGNTLNTAVSLKQTERVQCVELSAHMPEVLERTAVGPGVLASPKLQIEIGDGRNHLLNTRQRYDVISAEPPPPTHAGIVNLYSREYYQLCADRLAKDGVVAQWLPVFELSVFETKTIIRAFQDVFPYTYLWESESSQLCLIGKMEPLDLDYQRLVKAVEVNKTFLAQTGWDSAALVAALGIADPEQLRAYTKDVRPLTDDWPRIQYNHGDFAVDEPFFFFEPRERLLAWSATSAQLREIERVATGLLAFHYYPSAGPQVSTLERHELARITMATFPGDPYFQARFLATPARLAAARRALADHPGNPDDLFEIARIAFVNNDFSAAATAADQAAAAPSPRRGFYRMYAAMARYRGGQDVEGKMLAPITKQDIDSLDGRYLRRLFDGKKRQR